MGRQRSACAVVARGGAAAGRHRLARGRAGITPRGPGTGRAAPGRAIAGTRRGGGCARGGPRAAQHQFRDCHAGRVARGRCLCAAGPSLARGTPEASAARLRGGLDPERCGHGVGARDPAPANQRGACAGSARAGTGLDARASGSGGLRDLHVGFNRCAQGGGGQSGRPDSLRAGHVAPLGVARCGPQHGHGVDGVRGFGAYDAIRCVVHRVHAAPCHAGLRVRP
ncbi:hypothetical protein D3C72_1337700 [compost metagenome]